MWTADNRPRYNRDKLRYTSDLTDAEWAHIEPLIPPGKPGGGKRRVAIREVINGVMRRSRSATLVIAVAAPDGVGVRLRAWQSGHAMTSQAGSAGDRLLGHERCRV